MLNFIVLGQVPGTHIQLTFLQVLCFAAGFLMILVGLHAISERRKLLKYLLALYGVTRTRAA